MALTVRAAPSPSRAHARRLPVAARDEMPIDPRKRSCPAMPSPWYVHPFEAHERGVMGDLRYYSRNASVAERSELFATACWRLYGDYFRSDGTRGKKPQWLCPASEQGAGFEGAPNAYNAREWVETDAVQAMLYYLSSGDFYRMCNDAGREAELNAAGMDEDTRKDEIQRASNVLTSYYDVQVDNTLREAIRVHLNERDDRWNLENGRFPEKPETPTRSQKKPPASADRENEHAGRKTMSIDVHESGKSAGGGGIRRNASVALQPR